MRVRALVCFSGPLGSFAEDDVFELPEGVDWLRLGWVTPTAESEGYERAVDAGAVLMPDGGELTLIKGISAARAEMLAALGIESVAQLAEADAVRVAQAIKGVSQAQAQQWIADAIGMVG